MKKLNYDKLIAQNPTVYDKITNRKGQEIEFVEHPTLGDTSTVIAVFHKEKVAVDTDFFETDDMMAEHGEYTPILLENGTVKSGFEVEQ